MKFIALYIAACNSIILKVIQYIKKVIVYIINIIEILI